jgi:Sec-independent protein secretion pathway component TatC
MSPDDRRSNAQIPNEHLAKAREWGFWLILIIALWSAAQTMALTSIMLLVFILVFGGGVWVGWAIHEHVEWERG